MAKQPNELPGSSDKRSQPKPADPNAPEPPEEPKITRPDTGEPNVGIKGPKVIYLTESYDPGSLPRGLEHDEPDTEDRPIAEAED